MKSLKPRFSLVCALSVVVLSLFAGVGLASASSWSDDLKLKIDANVDLHFQNGSQVGLVVGVIRGNEIHFWSYGEKFRGAGVLPDADTFFEIGSITKTYTATLLALEVEKGTVSLQDPIERFWKELQGTDAGKITLQELASHTSGLPRMPTNFVMTDPANPYKSYDAVLLTEFLKSYKPTAPGPYPHAYSNVGLGVLGYILAEKINGLSFADYLEANLLKPLDLRETKTRIDPAVQPNFAQGYDTFFSLVPFWDLNVMDGAGVLKTSARDLLRFLELNMNADSSLIGRAMSLAQTQLFPTASKTGTVGLVWESRTFGRYNVIQHGGATGGFRADLMFDKREKLGAVVLSNTDLVPVCVLAPVFEAECEIPKYQPINTTTVSKLIGNFESKAIGIKAEVLLKYGQLGLLIDGQVPVRLWAKSALEYTIPDGKVEITFTTSATGTVDSFELKQGGQTYLFERR